MFCSTEREEWICVLSTCFTPRQSEVENFEVELDLPAARATCCPSRRKFGRHLNEGSIDINMSRDWTRDETRGLASYCAA